MVRREILRRVIAPHRNTRFSSFLLGFLSKKTFSKKLFTEPIVWFLVITSKANTLRRKRNEYDEYDPRSLRNGKNAER